MKSYAFAGAMVLLLGAAGSHAGPMTVTPTGVTFADGTTQTTAAGSGGASQWGVNGANLYYSAGSVGIGTTAPMATLDINGYARLAVNASAPAVCDTTQDGAIALTALYTLCACNNKGAWVAVSDGTTACNWGIISGTATIQSRAWNDNDGFVFSTETVVAAGGYTGATLANSADFLVETNMLGTGDAGVLDLGQTTLSAITTVATTGYTTPYFDAATVGHVYALQLPSGNYAIIEFTECATPVGDTVTQCVFNYKYRPDGGTSFQ